MDMKVQQTKEQGLEKEVGDGMKMKKVKEE